MVAKDCHYAFTINAKNPESGNFLNIIIKGHITYYCLKREGCLSENEKNDQYQSILSSVIPTTKSNKNLNRSDK